MQERININVSATNYEQTSDGIRSVLTSLEEMVHEEDGFAGNLARIRVASKYLERFGISTECGMGRRQPEVIPRWMELMAKLSENT